MVNYTCNKCLETFSRKSSYIRHIQRKFPCGSTSEIQLKIKLEIEKIKLKTSKIEFEKESLKYKRKPKENTIINNNTINTKTINITQNCINIISYGSKNEDISFINIVQLKDFFNKGVKGDAELFAIIHLNNDHPELNNVRLVRYKRDQLIEIYKDNGWNRISSNEFINKVARKQHRIYIDNYLKKEYENNEEGKEGKDIIIRRLKPMIECHEEYIKNLEFEIMQKLQQK